MERLNGWQRLWAVASIVTGLAFILVGWTHIPTEESEASVFYSQPTSGVTFHFKGGGVMDSDTDRARQYVGDMDDLIYRQAWYAGTLIAIWIGSCAALYGMGWLIGWVTRGFRHKAA